MTRLQKYLAECGICSRRKAEQLILNNEITVNGKIVNELGTKINPLIDEVFYKNKRVELKNDYIYIMLHKPIGYISSARDQFNRKTVLDLVKIKDVRLYPVGRLDYDTSGLILLTNDGELTFRLTHPKHNIKKIYLALLDGIPTKENINLFKFGMRIEDYKTHSAKLKILTVCEDKAEVEITLNEGKNRQVRKMCSKINCPVLNLKRISTGELNLDGLACGEYRYLTNDEIAYLKSL